MKRWIETRLVEPPSCRTISGRFGASIMFVAYFKWRREWRWIQPGHVEERIAPPTEIYLDEEWISTHPRVSPLGAESTGKIHRQKQQQLLLF